MVNKNRKLVLFGAGKIGRSFIGQLFSQGGYEVVFVDVFKAVIDELNAKGSYNVIIKSEGKDAMINITNVRGVLAADDLKVIEEIASADILAVSVGQQGLKSFFPLLTEGLIKRNKQFGNLPLDIIIAENLRNAAEYFHNELEKILPIEYPIDQLVGLVETSIGKMVPFMLKKDIEEDILQVFSEPYNNLILDKKGFKNPIPEIEGLSPKDNMKAWVDRKLFIHNLGHATTAYVGYLYNPGFTYLYEALAVPKIYNYVRSTMLQAADILLKKYPDEFTSGALTEHINDLIFRFKNKALGDTIFRVGCDLTRKLGPEDRLVGAVRLANELGLPYDRILVSIACACRFMATDENGRRMKDDEQLAQKYAGNVRRMMLELSDFNQTTEMDIVQTIINLVDKIDQKAGNVFGC